MSSRSLSIKGKRKGERVAISNCNIEPLNLLIPGGGPILVPKNKAWPGQKKKKTTVAVEIPLTDEDYYDAEEEDELEERLAAEVKSRKVSQAARASPEKKKRKEKVARKVDAKKPTRADVEERDREKLTQRIKEHEEYIAQLKARYKDKKAPAKAPEETEPDASTGTETETDATTADGAAQSSETDTAAAAAGTASEKVRGMLRAIRIEAAGAGGEGFTPSEDAQILARKEAGESFGVIAGFMKRTRKQVSQRYGELVAAGKTAETAGTDGPGEGAAAAGAGATGAEGAGGAQDGAQVVDGDFGGLFDLGGLTTALEAVAEEQAEGTEKKEEKKDSPAKNSDKASKKDKRQKNKPSPGQPKGDVKNTTPPRSAAAEGNGGESGYEGGSEAVPADAGARLYINQYARQLLRHKDRIPEADDKFDENDCILLAMAESHLKHGKWEQIQASFANATGRMVPVEVLKYKLGGGEKPDGY